MTHRQLETGFQPKSPAVLFCDVSGWTELCARIGDAAAKDIVDALFAELRRAVEGPIGWVKSIGDELMCVFYSLSDAAHSSIEM